MSVSRGESRSGSILVVDDDPAMRSMIERFLKREGHQVETAESAEQALDRLASDPYDIVLTDLQMPGTSGLDLLGEIHTRWPLTRTILMSGQAKATDAAVAIERGVDQLLVKPFELETLRAGVIKALGERDAHQGLARERELFEAANRQREMTSRIWVLRAAHALATAVEAKDSYTGGHASRVTAFALVLAQEAGEVDIPSLRLAGQLHDVGKIGIPDAVLNKPGRLTDEEFAHVRKHPSIGARILEPLIDDRLVIGVVRWHHERWDGKGYPDALAGEKIPLAARILAVADSLDAMTSSRAYRERLPWEAAVAQILEGAGSQFDPGVVTAFQRALPRLVGLYSSFGSETVEKEIG